jgi:protein-tyrosine kinase
MKPLAKGPTGKAAQQKRGPSRLVVLDDPRSFMAEAYRVLRTNLHYANPDAPIRRILLTSAGEGEGKSTTAANLAVCFAQADHNVLLVDADMRRPTLANIFSLPGSPGLSSYLGGDALLDAVVQKTPVPNLCLVTSGPTPPNPAELVGSRRMRDMLAQLGERFDVILLDSPPVLAVSDAGILAAAVDGVLLVVGSGSVPRMALRRAKEAIQAVQGKIVGAVLNRFDATAQGYPRRYYDRYDRYYTDGSR